ncbi:MAG: hypothetical protein AAFO03_15405 [Bacteroidota bacterium]
MKWITLFIGSLLFSITLLAQAPKGFGIVGGVDYVERTQFTITPLGDTPPVHYRLGVNYHSQIEEKWWFTSGLRFTHVRFDTGHEMLLDSFTFVPQFFPGTTLTEADVADGYRLRDTDYYLEIPLSIRYFLRDKQRFYLEGGVALNFYLSTFSTIDLVTGRRRNWTRYSAMDKMLASLRFGLGWQFPINENQYLSIQPTFRYFSPFESDYRMYSAGLEVGYRW